MADMEQTAIIATKRNVTGKRVEKLRQAGILPAVLYGYNVETQPIEINEKDFAKTFRSAGESTIVNLLVDGKNQPVLIQEVQHHYLTGQPIHVDFYAVNMTEKIKVRVPLHFIKESPAVKALGGTLVKNLLEVEVECLPGDLPHAIEVDISPLNTFEDAIRISDLKISGKVTIIGNLEEVIVAVTPPRSEEEMKSLEEVVTEDVTKVEGVVKPEVTEPGAVVDIAAEDKKPASAKASNFAKASLDRSADKEEKKEEKKEKK